jgi:hypothetical protein
VNEKIRNNIIIIKAGLMINSEEIMLIHRIKTINNIHKVTESVLIMSKCSFKKLISFLLKELII